MKKTEALKSIALVESAVFRVGQLARRLLTEQPDLTRHMVDIRLDADPETPRISIDVDTLDQVRAWAEQAGVELVQRFHQYSAGLGCESLAASTVVDGIELRVAAAQLFYDADGWEARLAEAGLPEVHGRAA